MRQLKLLGFGLGLLSVPSLLQAATTLGEVAENLMVPTEIVTKLVLVACYVVGFALILVSFAQYKIHKQSPKLVPLSTPITLLILGIIALLIPYGSTIFGVSFSAEQQAKEEGRSKTTTTLPLPDVDNRGPGLPLPSGAPPSEERPKSNGGSSEGGNASPGSSGNSSGGRHWTDRY